jgi:cupin fold WbuC family metalloprotein
MQLAGRNGVADNPAARPHRLGLPLATEANGIVRPLSDGIEIMIKRISERDLSALSETAAGASRLRSNLNVHDTLDAPVQRLFIATQPGTYMRPHRHPEPHKWEFFVVLDGRIDLLVFDDSGRVIERTPMSHSHTRAVEIPPNTWHAYACMQPGTVALEIKQGAYIPTSGQDFAPWSPAENSPDASRYASWMRGASVNEAFA